jgi:hypothetical protein
MGLAMAWGPTMAWGLFRHGVEVPQVRVFHEVGFVHEVRDRAEGPVAVARSQQARS